ncbi:hypothetical protein PSm6_34190 [Pseudomonas solani]|uniref:Uncharacterized protein n=1 Tax=Pseudomonas solani TaxID=2731552 RepID=A0ABM7LC82_9PSED|nr:hypothetical protein PSm6_34190 [Pseudomonas solani]
MGNASQLWTRNQIFERDFFDMGNDLGSGIRATGLGRSRVRLRPTNGKAPAGLGELAGENQRNDISKSRGRYIQDGREGQNPQLQMQENVSVRLAVG